MKTRRRTRVAKGIYSDTWGLAGTVKVGKVQRERRFPADTPHDEIKSWQIRTRAEPDAQRRYAGTLETPAPNRGTFAADVPRYLTQIAGRVSYRSDRSHLRAWLPFIGPMTRTAIRRSHVRASFAAWLTAGKSARTIRHRRRVLRDSRTP